MSVEVVDVAGWRAEDFAPFVGESFSVELDGVQAPVIIKLTEALCHPRAASNGRPFTLVFEAVGQIPMSQDLYWLNQAGMGRVQLFLVPISDDGTCRCYEAAFN